MNQINDDFVEVCEAFDILDGRKRSQRPIQEVVREAIAAWERVDKALYGHFAKIVADDCRASSPTLKRPRAKP